MLCDRAKAIRKIHDFAESNHWSLVDCRLLDRKNDKLSFVMTYVANDTLQGAIIIDDKILVNRKTDCASSSKYIVEYFREEVM